MDTSKLEILLQAMTRVNASALHLVPRRVPALRVQRRFVNADAEPLAEDALAELTRDMLFADHRQQLAERGHVEVLYRARSGRRHRATVADTDGELSLVFRPVPEAPPQLAELEVPEQVAGFTRLRSGFVAVAGFFGSGKTATLAGIVEACNQDGARHVVTIEDAIQFVHSNGAALLHQREVGRHVATAHEGVQQAMALGADTIVVGEVADAATLDAVLSAAESGCLVFGGVEAGSVVGAIARLATMVAPEERPRLRTRLAQVLRGAAAQCLLHRTHKPGRVPVVEVLVASPAVRNAIRSGRVDELQQIMQRCRGLGMQTTDIALRTLLNRHSIAPEEALLHAMEPDQVASRSRGR